MLKKYVYPLVSAFCIGLVVVATIINVVTPSNTVTAEKIQVPLVDTLPLANGGEITIEIVGDEKHVRMTFDNFEYIAKKRSITKKILKSVEALFARLEG